MLEYITQEEFIKTNEQMFVLARQIGGFIKYLENKKKNGEFVIR